MGGSKMFKEGFQSSSLERGARGTSLLTLKVLRLRSRP